MIKQIPTRVLACRVDAALKLTRGEVERRYGVKFELPAPEYRSPDRPNETQCFLELESGGVTRLIADNEGEVSIFTCADPRDSQEKAMDSQRSSYWTGLDEVLESMELTRNDCSWIRTGGPFGLGPV